MLFSAEHVSFLFLEYTLWKTILIEQEIWQGNVKVIPLYHIWYILIIYKIHYLFSYEILCIFKKNSRLSMTTLSTSREVSRMSFRHLFGHIYFNSGKNCELHYNWCTFKFMYCTNFRTNGLKETLGVSLSP